MFAELYPKPVVQSWIINVGANCDPEPMSPTMAAFLGNEADARAKRQPWAHQPKPNDVKRLAREVARQNRRDIRMGKQ